MKESEKISNHIKDNTNSQHYIMYLINEIKNIIYAFLNAKDHNRSIVTTQQWHMLSSFSNNIINYFQDYSRNKFNDFDSFFNYFENHYYEIHSNKDETNLVSCLNFYIEFYHNILDNNPDEISLIHDSLAFLNFNKNLERSVKILKDYSIIFENKQFRIGETSFFLKNISFTPLNELIYKYYGSIEVSEKRDNLQSLCIKTLHILKRDSVYSESLKDYFSNNQINTFREQCNLWRHSSADSKKSLKKKQASIKEMNKIISLYLFIFSILRENDLLKEFEKSFDLLDEKNLDEN